MKKRKKSLIMIWEINKEKEINDKLLNKCLNQIHSISLHIINPKRTLNKSSIVKKSHNKPLNLLKRNTPSRFLNFTPNYSSSDNKTSLWSKPSDKNKFNTIYRIFNKKIHLLLYSIWPYLTILIFILIFINTFDSTLI